MTRLHNLNARRSVPIKANHMIALTSAAKIMTAPKSAADQKIALTSVAKNMIAFASVIMTDSRNSKNHTGSPTATTSDRIHEGKSGCGSIRATTIPSTTIRTTMIHSTMIPIMTGLTSPATASG